MTLVVMARSLITQFDKPPLSGGFIPVGRILICITAVFGCSQSTYGQAPAPSGCPYWIDAKTNERVKTFPAALSVADYRVQAGGISSSGHASSSLTGQTFVSTDGGVTWIDSATGQSVETVPGALSVSDYTMQAGGINSSGHASSSLTGQTFVRIPCPPPAQSAAAPSTPGVSWTGPFVGPQFAVSLSTVHTQQFSAFSGTPTTDVRDAGSGPGGGINAGWNWQPWGDTSIFGVIVDVNLLNDSVSHRINGGVTSATIGSTVTASGSVQLRAGILPTPDILIYGQGGVSIANQNVKLEFNAFGTTISQTESRVTPGLTLGGGAEWRLPLPPIGSVVKATSVFFDYQHTWWRETTLNQPTVAPFSNYTWRRQSDVVRFGVRIRFGPE